MTPCQRIFQVRFGPGQPQSFQDEWPNNLRLTGAGTLEVGVDAVIVADQRNLASRARRTFALADIANVSYADDPDGQVVALRTRRDPREVLVWMASGEDAQALLALLPRATTPEFLERRRRNLSFEENLEKIAPHARMTPVLIGINVAVFLLLVSAGAGFLLTDGRVEARFGSDLGPLTWGGQPWRLLSAAFIHFGALHLAMNMFALLSLGLLAERLYGSTRFALIYLLAAVAGNVASGWWDRTSNSAGASGAIFGVFGALLVFAWRRSADLPLEVPGRARSAALLFLVYSLVIGYLLPSTVSVAHAGGLLGGTLAGLLLIRPFEPAARSVPQPWRVLAVGAGLFALLVALSVPLLARSGMR